MEHLCACALYTACILLVRCERVCNFLTHKCARARVSILFILIIMKVFTKISITITVELQQCISVLIVSIWFPRFFFLLVSSSSPFVSVGFVCMLEYFIDVFLLFAVVVFFSHLLLWNGGAVVAVVNAVKKDGWLVVSSCGLSNYKFTPARSVESNLYIKFCRTLIWHT